MNKSNKKVDGLERTVSVIGDKWTPLLVSSLAKGPQSFCTLEQSLEGISPRTLSQRLERLESSKIIDKKCYCSKPPRFQYCLTKRGKDLVKVVSLMSNWGAKYS